MPIKVTINKKKYLIYNYKCMSTSLHNSTLNNQCLREFKFLRDVLYSNFRFSSAEFHILTRNPYDRLESFFKHKLRKRVIKIRKTTIPWELSQKLFFPSLSLTETTPRAQVAEALMGLSFCRFISLLPEIYNLDWHLTPQFYSMYVPRYPSYFFRIPIRIADIYKMENPGDLCRLERRFDITIGKFNVADSDVFGSEIGWGRNEIKIVNQIYTRDFDCFEYTKRT